MLLPLDLKLLHEASTEPLRGIIAPPHAEAFWPHYLHYAPHFSIRRAGARTSRTDI